MRPTRQITTNSELDGRKQLIHSHTQLPRSLLNLLATWLAGNRSSSAIHLTVCSLFSAKFNLKLALHTDTQLISSQERSVDADNKLKFGPTHSNCRRAVTYIQCFVKVPVFQLEPVIQVTGDKYGKVEAKP